MDGLLPLGMRIEIGKPIRLDTTGPSRWVCLGKLKAKPRIPGVSTTGLPRLDEPRLDEGGVTATLFVIRGSGGDPEEAIRDATAQLLRHSSLPPPFDEAVAERPTLRPRPPQPTTVPPLATTRARWWFTRMWSRFRRQR